MSEGRALPPRPHLPPALWALLCVLACERAVLPADVAPTLLVAFAAGCGVLGLVTGATLALRRRELASLPVALTAAACAALVASAGELSSQAALERALSQTPVSSWELRVTTDMSEGASGWRGRADALWDGAPRGEVWLLAEEEVPVGSTVRCVGRFSPNGDDEWGASSRAQGIAGTVRAVRVMSRSTATGPLGWIYALRERVLESLAPTSSDERALLAGSVCAWDTAMSARGLDDAFAVCGVSHLVAVSGSHLVLVCAALSWALSRTRLGPALRGVVLLAVSGAFVLFCAAPVSAVRSWAMSAVAALSGVVGRRAHPLSGACLVALVMAVADPGVSGQLAYLLSVTCVCGICALGGYARVAVRLALPTAAGLARRGRLGKALRGAIDGTSDVLALTLVSQLLTAPLTCSVFGQLSLVAPLANVALAPFFSALLALGLLAAALVWLPAAQAVVLAACDGVCAVVMAIVRALGRMPLASVAVSVDEGGALLVVGLLLAVLLVAWPRPSRAGVVVALLVAALLGAGWVVTTWVRAPTCVRVLDVGQGDATLVSDGASSLLVDTGPPGAITGALARNAVFHLDAVVITHLHDDHVGGLADVAYMTGAARAYVPEGAAKGLAAPEGMEVVEVGYGDVLRVGGFSLEVVSPTGPVDGMDNEDSLELLLSYDEGGRSLTALLTGDAERDVTQAAIARGDVGDVDLLKVGHHGSEISVTPEIAEALDAEVAVASAGAGNSYGHPDPACVEMLEAAGSLFLCTIEAGDVRVEPGPDGPVVSCQHPLGCMVD